MLIFANYSKSNIALQTINNSLVFQLYQKITNEKQYYKSTNVIRGFYKDTILDDFFYFSTNGLNTAIIQKKWINTNSFQSKSNSFVSYFSELEDKFLRFNIYPKKYFRKSVKKYIRCQEKISNFEKHFFNSSINLNNKKYSLIEKKKN